MLFVSQRYIVVARPGSYIAVKTLENFRISFLQRMLRLRWWDKVPHVEIRHRAHCLSMVAIIAEHQLRWTGHVIRMPENRLSRRVLYGELKDIRNKIYLLVFDFV